MPSAFRFRNEIAEPFAPRSDPISFAAPSIESVMTPEANVRISESLRNVRYEIRGGLARRALELSRKGYEIISDRKSTRLNSSHRT